MSAQKLTPLLRKKLQNLVGLYGVDKDTTVSFATRSNITKGPDGKPTHHPTGYESLVAAGLISEQILKPGDVDETAVYSLTDAGQEALKG